MWSSVFRLLPQQVVQGITATYFQGAFHWGKPIGLIVKIKSEKSMCHCML